MKTRNVVYILVSLMMVSMSLGSLWGQVYPPNGILSVQILATNAQPSYLVPITDPVYGTRVTRVSDQAAFTSTAQRLAHAYAKNQPWNCDGTLIKLDYIYPCVILDAKTYRLLRRIHHPGYAVWSNLDPNLTYGISINNFVSCNMTIDWTYTTLHAFPEYDKVDFGSGEGNLSDDDRYVVLTGHKGSTVELLVYDIKNNIIVSRTSLPMVAIDYATISPSGNYVIINFDAQPSIGQPPARYQGMEVYDRNMNFLRNVSSRGGTHADYGYDMAGHEVIICRADQEVGVTHHGLVMVELGTGIKTSVLADSTMGWGFHVSCRNINRRGWAYVSQFGETYSTRPYYQKVFALKLDGSQTVEVFAQEHHSTVDEYNRCAMAVPNRDGTKVMWASDWGNTTTNAPVCAYVADEVSAFAHLSERKTAFHVYVPQNKSPKSK